MSQDQAGTPPLVVGIDGGGTSTRAAIADTGGNILAAAKGPGMNPSSGGTPEAAIRATLEKALEPLTPSQRAAIRGGVAGLAGAFTNHSELDAAASSAWSDLNLPGRLKVVSDLVVAFWSGSFPATVKGGYTLVAGTGAVAGLVEGDNLVAVADGYGYLLGDRGGGVWLGIEAARAALDHAKGRGQATVLTELVLGETAPGDFIAELYRRPPRELGRLAPFVDRAVDAGDAVATAIRDQAVTELIGTLDSLHPDDRTEPGLVVLVGSVAAGDNPVGRALRQTLADQGWDVVIGSSGIAGAVTLAVRDAGTDR